MNKVFVLFGAESSFEGLNSAVSRQSEVSESAGSPLKTLEENSHTNSWWTCNHYYMFITCYYMYMRIITQSAVTKEEE